MPMNFPDMNSLIYMGKMLGFRPPHEDEAEQSYRHALADFDQDPIEATEIRTGKGWDQWSEGQKALALLEALSEPAVCPRCGLELDSEVAESWRAHNQNSAECERERRMGMEANSQGLSANDRTRPGDHARTDQGENPDHAPAGPSAKLAEEQEQNASLHEERTRLRFQREEHLAKIDELHAQLAEERAKREAAEQERDAALAQAAAVQEACAKAFDGTTWQPYKHPSEIIRSLLIIPPMRDKEPKA